MLSRLINKNVYAMRVSNRCFSSYWKQQDKAAMLEFNKSFCGSKAYTQAVDMWKVPLAKKAAKREKKA